MRIGNRRIGTGEKCFIIAEAGVNHNGNVDLALEMVDKAAATGVDAIKFQTFNVDLLAATNAEKAAYQTSYTNSNESQYEMLKKLELPIDAYGILLEQCRKRNLLFMSTPFDHDSVDLLEKFKIEIYKISSGEITNVGLLRYIAEKKKPIILSTGMATVAEIRSAVKVISDTGNEQLILLQCTSNYPADPSDINLKAMETLAVEFGIPIGFSDHTLGWEIAFAAVALGACVIEKHFTLNKEFSGPDHKMSLTPDELAEMVLGIRNIEQAIGDGIKGPVEREKNTALVARKSIHYRVDLSAGKELEEKDIVMLRPGDGVAPVRLCEYLGKKLKKRVNANHKLFPEDFE